MEPRSVTASLIAILQLTTTVAQYLNDLKDAPKEYHRSGSEVLNLRSLLVKLLYRLEEGETTKHESHHRNSSNGIKQGELTPSAPNLDDIEPWYAAVEALNIKNGPIDQYKRALEQLQSKIGPGTSTHDIKKRLLWTFIKAEVTSTMARMERLKTLISIALEMDHL